MIANAAFVDAPATMPFVNPNLVQQLATELEEKGAVRMPTLLSAATLHNMQEQFARRLQHLRWNNCDGYERSERYRLMVQDVLTLDQGFVDLALHPLVKAVLDQYLGPHYELCEAKGWQSLRTLKDFHGWHGDMWYDQTKMAGRIPREVKLAYYLSDVKSGAFQYITGSHGKVAPFHLGRSDVEKLPLDRMVEFLGPAGEAVLFDTSGIHRQGIPILEPRRAVFYNYHDPDVPLQTEDVEYYRYHPLLLNAAFLGNLSQDDCRILGFGNKANYQPGFARKSSHPRFQRLFENLFTANIRVGDFTSKAWNKLSRLLGMHR
jgi:hypothetical protein